MRRKHETVTNFNQMKEITQVIMLKKGALNPTKKAFSERQKTTLKNGQKSANERRKTEQGLNSNLREKPSEQAFKPGLVTHQEKGGSNEA
ncbi:hypothetical protein ACQKAF_05640 [Helicobacter pylori]